MESKVGFNTFFKRFRGDESGSIAIWAGVALPMVLGISALAFDMNSMYVTKAQLQQTADASALAAARALPDTSAAVAAAQYYANLNMPSATNGTVVASNDVTPGNWNASSHVFTPGGTPLNAVQVAARRSQENGNPLTTSIGAALGITSVDASASTIAAADSVPGSGGTCIVALNTSAPAAFHIHGNAEVRTRQCDIQVNSSDASGILADGLTLVKITGDTGQIRVVGGVTENGPAYFDPTPTTGAAVVADVYDGLTFPTPEACTPEKTNYSHTGDDAPVPGTYCNGMQFSGTGTVTFEGEYIINGGEVSIGGNIIANSGTAGVTFFLTGGATIKFVGTSDIGLKAPTGGTQPGFIIFGDKTSPPAAGDYNMIRGTTMGGYNGKIYLPGAKVDMGGTAVGTLGGSDCTVVVADTFEFGGTPIFEAEDGCTDFPQPPVMAGSARIVN